MLFLLLLMSLFLLQSSSAIKSSLEVTGIFYEASLPRTGSTLVFNAMQHAFPNATVIKSHNMLASCLASSNMGKTIGQKGEIRYVQTFRHPYDMIMSLALVNRNRLSVHTDEAIFTERSVTVAVHEVKKFAMEVCGKCQHLTHCNSSVIQLMYSRFIDDFEYIFDGLELFTNSRISQEIRNSFNKTFDVAKLRDATRDKAFSMYDNANKNNKFSVDPNVHGIHGSHISQYLGHGSWKDVFSVDIVNVLKKEVCFSQIIEALQLEGINGNAKSVHLPQCKYE